MKITYMTLGDSVTFNLVVESQSNVDIQHRSSFTRIGGPLYEHLAFKARSSRDEEGSADKIGLYYTRWETLSPPTGADSILETVSFDIELPITETMQNASCDL